MLIIIQCICCGFILFRLFPLFIFPCNLDTLKIHLFVLSSILAYRFQCVLHGSFESIESKGWCSLAIIRENLFCHKIWSVLWNLITQMWLQGTRGQTLALTNYILYSFILPTVQHSLQAIQFCKPHYIHTSKYP